MPDESVKVAVRVRPFNQREKDRQSKLVIQMQGQMTIISNPEQPNDESKKFSFDYSYWSHDGYNELGDGILEAKPGSNYASQRKVFSDLGQGVLDNAFEGYNCSLFAYGQTGSGKSYSMVGYGKNRGIVPITCDELFKTMSTNTDANKRFEVTFSMLEIYNEQVRDLLSRDNPKGGLQVRQNPKEGCFYVENLKKVPVGSYEDIEKRMEQGTASRTVASTNMNATSSRAHTVVTITFDQILKGDSGETKKSSVMNLVDLAGSERADSTGATGDRLKEGANINKSLSALGNVISALADLSMGTKKKIVVPYRDSVLTKLLQNALGGNSKTIMIAALSPADINYDETLSTLRYADRAKKIKNKAVINENPLDKLIRELKEENEKLRKAMEAGGIIQGSEGMTPEQIAQMKKQMEEEIRAQLMANQAMIADSAESWEQKLAAARSEHDAISGPSDAGRKSRDPHLINLNEDPMLSGVITHFLESGETTIGRKDASPKPTICLSGLSIEKKHAVITNSKGKIEIASSSSNSKTKVNGLPLQSKKELCHKDRIVFGSNHVYVFINPQKKDTATDDLPDDITWEFVQKEIAKVKGFATGSAGLSKDQQIAQEQVLEILPMVSEVNAVSEELNKHKSFEVVLISAAAQEGGDIGGANTKVMVKMKNLLNGNTWLWERGKFMNRRYLIQDVYQKYLDGEDVSKIPKEQDPFWEPTEDVLIGTANVFLQTLLYALDFSDDIAITDYKGGEEGQITVHVTPCSQNGKPLDEDSFVEDPKELIGKPYHFQVTVQKAQINKARFSKGISVKYKVNLSSKSKDFIETPIVKNTLEPEFKHSKVISIPKLKAKHLQFFEHGCITFCVYGKQEDTLPDPKLLKLTTRELREMTMNQELRQMDTNIEQPITAARRGTIFHNDMASDQSHLKTELALLQRKYERLASKEKRMQQVCDEWSNKDPSEQQYEPFFRTVSAVAYSTGTKLRTRVQLLNQFLRLQKLAGQGSKSQNNEQNSNPTSTVQQNSMLAMNNPDKMLRQRTMDLPSQTVLQGQKFVREMANQSDEDKKNLHNHDDGDTVSLFVFGEDEQELANEAECNDGVVPYQKIRKHHFSEITSQGKNPYQRRNTAQTLLERNNTQSFDQDSLNSVDLAPYMKVDTGRKMDKNGIVKRNKGHNVNDYKRGASDGQPVLKKGDNGRRINSASGGKQDGSSACVIQ